MISQMIVRSNILDKINDFYVQLLRNRQRDKSQVSLLHDVLGGTW